jgi:hypothetical protein
MMTGSVQNMRNMWGDGVGLFSCGWETVGSVKMGRMAIQISAIEAAASQAKSCCPLQISVSYAKLLATFADERSFGKSRNNLRGCRPRYCPYSKKANTFKASRNCYIE